VLEMAVLVVVLTQQEAMEEAQILLTEQAVVAVVAVDLELITVLVKQADQAD
jgi:hypothetical protein